MTRAAVTVALACGARLRDSTVSSYKWLAMPQPVQLASLGDFIANGTYEIAAHCWRCRRHESLDLAALAERHGRALAIPKLRTRLRCSRCGQAGEISISQKLGAVARYARD